MRHHNKNRKFGRERNQRRALLRSLASSLIKKGKIRTTEAKAKELRPFVEKLVTQGKHGTLAQSRLIISRLGGDKVSGSKLFKEIAPKYAERKGGYIRIVKLPRRLGDGSPMAMIEFV
ncbi:MAG: 50S ribosomal protein L17 [Parcubacteria group bacterium]|nr:50S ribosomal protein L17 [Parcubacteria group bacterium]